MRHTIEETYYTCDRCGKKFEEIRSNRSIGWFSFSKTKGKSISKQDYFIGLDLGDFTTIEEIEEAVDKVDTLLYGIGLLYNREYVHLCYNCAKKYNRLIKDFMNNKDDEK